MTTKPSFQTIINAVKSLLNKSNNSLKSEFYTNILDLRHRLSESDFDFDNFTINGWTPDLAVFPKNINTCLILSVNKTYDNEHDGSTTCHTYVQGLDEYILETDGLFSYPSVNTNDEETKENDILMLGDRPFNGESQHIQDGQQWIREILTECQNL